MAAENEIDLGQRRDLVIEFGPAVGEADDEVGLPVQFDGEPLGDRDGVLEDVVGHTCPEGLGVCDLWGEADDGDTVALPLAEEHVIADHGREGLALGYEIGGEDGEGCIAQLAFEKTPSGV